MALPDSDEFRHHYSGKDHGGSSLDWPAVDAFAITPSNTVDLTKIPRGIYVGVEGNVKVDMALGGTVTFIAVPVGIFPIRPKRVYATGTTATNLIALT